MLLGAALGGAPAACVRELPAHRHPAAGAPGLRRRSATSTASTARTSSSRSWRSGSVGVMLNRGDGTFGAAAAVHGRAGVRGPRGRDVTLGDVTRRPASSCRTASSMRTSRARPTPSGSTGDGTGALGSPFAVQPEPAAVPRRRPRSISSRWSGARTAIRSRCSRSSMAVGSFGRELCLSYDLDGESARLQPHAGRRGRWPSATSTAASPACLPDEIVTSRGRGRRWASSASSPQFPLDLVR